MVIAFFMKTLTGKNYIGNNPPDDVLKFLTIIGYPYTITKSLLKTPNVPHAYPIIVDILRWLCDLIDIDDTIAEFEKNEYILVDNQYPDQEYTKIFWDNVKDNFCYWNDGKDNKVEACCDWLIDEFIRKKFIDNNAINNYQNLCNEISKLEIEHKSFLLQKISTKKESILQEKKEKLQKLQMTKQQLQNKYDELVFELNDIRQNDIESQAELLRKEKKCEHIQSIIDKQKYSIDELKMATNMLAELQQKIITKNEMISKLKDNCFPIEISIARLQKQLIEIIAKHNAFITKMITVCKQYNIIDDKSNNLFASNLLFDLDNFQINDKYNQIIDEIIINLEQIRLNIHEKIALKSNEIVSLQNDEKLITHECELLMAKEEQLNDILEELRIEILNCDMKILNQKHINEISVKECKERCENLAKELNEKQEKIKELDKKRIEMIEKNDKIVQRVKEKADEMLAARKKDLENSKLVIAEFDKDMKKITDRF